MFKDVKNIDDMAETWNKRFQECLVNNTLTQSGFAKRMNKAREGDSNGSVTQQSVSRWLHVNPDKEKGALRQFPEFQTMKNIADIFDVDIGYLIGETDYSTFTMEDACEYTGLDEKAMESLIHVTGENGTKGVLLYGGESYTFRALISSLLKSNEFINFMLALKRLKDAYDELNVLKKESPYDEYVNAEPICPENAESNCLSDGLICPSSRIKLSV